MYSYSYTYLARLHVFECVSLCLLKCVESLLLFNLLAAAHTFAMQIAGSTLHINGGELCLEVLSSINRTVCVSAAENMCTKSRGKSTS